MVGTRRFPAVLICFSALVVQADPPPRFSAPSVWHQDISAAALHADSSSMINTLDGLGGFGNGGRFQIDFGLQIVHADPGAPTRLIEEHASFGYFLPDCDDIGTAIPVPADASIEAQLTTGDLDCDNTSEDCHLLVVQDGVLYETFSSTESMSGQIEALCLAVWYLDVEYPPEGRGDHCTSADAAGFPIAPLLFNADEIADSLATDPTGDGDLGHAIRFILPNSRMASDVTLGGVGGRLYVRPATHAGAPSGPTGSIPYGARLRLKSSFPLTNYHPAPRVVLNTLKRYGMVLSDGGSIALTAESDLYTTNKWDDAGINIGSRVFVDQIDTPMFEARPVLITDFEIIDTGPRIAETFDCVRSTIVPPEDRVFRDSFE